MQLENLQHVEKQKGNKKKLPYAEFTYLNLFLEALNVLHCQIQHISIACLLLTIFC